jgi:translation initiation factor 1
MKAERRSGSRLVYTTDRSDLYCFECGETRALCQCEEQSVKTSVKSDICLRKEKKGRRGKTVTTLSGLPGSPQELKDLAADLKRFCGSGGSVKEGIIIIQGDHRQKILTWLEVKGYKIKLTGG